MKKHFKITVLTASAILLLLSGCRSDSAQQTGGAGAADKKISIKELREREQKVLTSYALIDAKKGTYRIPVSKAMELIAAEAAK